MRKGEGLVRVEGKATERREGQRETGPQASQSLFARLFSSLLHLPELISTRLVAVPARIPLANNNLI